MTRTMGTLKITKTALVLQGGGARGLFTAGVLDVLLEHKIYFPYCLGVSAGAYNALNYVARQRGRSHKLIRDLLSDHRFASRRNFLKTGNYFDFHFLLEEVPRKILPFDEKAFQQSRTRFVCSAFDCDEGRPVFFYQHGDVDLLPAVAASASLPILARIVTIDGKRYLDGGLADPFPYERALKDGHEKVVVILTREKGFRKKEDEDRHPFLARLRYPGRGDRLIREAIRTWAIRDNDRYALIEAADPEKVFIIRPDASLGITRTSRDREKIERAYLLGRVKGEEILSDLLAFLHE